MVRSRATHVKHDVQPIPCLIPTVFGPFCVPAFEYRTPD